MAVRSGNCFGIALRLLCRGLYYLDMLFLVGWNEGVSMIMNLFSSRPEHPLGEPKELKRVLAELPLDNAFKTVDEIHGWLESLRHAEGFRVDHLFDVVRQLDEIGLHHVRRLTRDYLHSPRLSKSEERRLWTMCFNYWGEVAGLYALCVQACERNPKDKSVESMKTHLPLMTARLVASRAVQQKWMAYRYGIVGEDLWRGIGSPYLTAVAAGYAQKPVQLYPAQPGLTSVGQQYLQALVLASSSTDSLMPLEIELADRLITHLLPGFSFVESCQQDSVYWIDAAEGKPPIRLARSPLQLTPGMRFFAPGDAHRVLQELIRVVERGEVPKDLNLGGEYPARIVLPVLRHLAMYWAPEPPQRSHPRHPVKTRMAVIQGFDDCFTLFSGSVARLGKERTAESWIVENVSLGGFRARVETLGEWLKIGVLLGMQPERGENWVLGVVRRCSKDSESQASVGIQSLSRQPRSIELRSRAAGFSATGAIPGICLDDLVADGDVRVVLPLGNFDVRESLEFFDGERRCLLTPVELETSGANFEIARYRWARAD